jgi:hypothetical protein
MDVLVAGIMLAIGLTAIITLGTRALALQQRGEREVVAAALLDELLATALAEGPEDFVRIHPLAGTFDPPFEEFEFEVTVEDGGLGIPARVLARVFHTPTGGAWMCETLIAVRVGAEPHPPRTPFQPIDREQRYRQQEEEESRG